MPTGFTHLHSHQRNPNLYQAIDNDSAATSSNTANFKTTFSASSATFSARQYPSNTERLNAQPLNEQDEHISKNNDYSSTQLFKTLFGAEISNWPYSESSLDKSLSLRISQENTKQEYYKVEQLNRILDIMKLAAVAKIPGHLIPSLLVNKISKAQTLASESKSESMFVDQNTLLQTPPQSSGFSPSNSPSPTKTNPHRHSKNKTMSSLYELQSNSNTNAQQQHSELDNARSPANSLKNFKFGIGSSSSTKSFNGIQKKRTLLPPKHQLSPSRIGAHAISCSSLNRHSNNPNNKNFINLMNFRHGTNHKRTLSLPATVSIPECEQMSFHKTDDNNVMKDSNALNIQLNIPNLQHNCNASNNVDIDTDIVADKLLNGTSTELKEFLKHKKLTGSPLKEMVTMTQDSITNHEENNTLMNLSDEDHNVSTFPSSATPRKVLVFEPKTP